MGRGMNNQGYLDRQAARESNARTYPRHLPIVIDKAQGIHVTDVDGKVYLDCLCGAGALTLGHNHPVVVAALREHLDSGRPMMTLDLSTPIKDAFVESLMATLPPALGRNGRIQFCAPSGSDAIEAALKLVKVATGRRGILAFSGGYHGHGHGALAMMGERSPKTAISGLMPDVHFLPFPYPFRCQFGSVESCGCAAGAADSSACSHFMKSVLSDPLSGLPPIAAAMVEPVQGEGGVHPAPPSWLRGLAEATTAQGIVLIVDEVQTGWGRTGRLYGFEHAGIVPDVVVLSKAIGGGLPMAVIVYRGDLDKWQPGAHAGTFRGNQMAMAAGTATLKYILENDLPAHAATMGMRLRARLDALLTRYDFFGEIRGLGLMLGVEIVSPRDSDALGRPAPDGTLARRLQAAFFRHGLIVELGGRNASVVRLLPPLTITPAEVDAVAAAFETAVAEVSATV